MTIVSGIQPSGKLHVGNALGAVRQWLALQDTPSSSPSGRGGENTCFFFIADWHSLTEEYDAGEKATQVRELAAELLALGVGTPSGSPSSRGGGKARVALFRQSDLPEHLELAWYFSCIAPVGELERMTQYKDKLAHGESPTVGLFTYPVLMAADILAYSAVVGAAPRGRPLRTGGDPPSRDATEGHSGAPPLRQANAIGVPVGDDQKQHLELANDIVRRFNNRYGETFPTIRGIHTPTPRVMSLKDPTRKMSKSAGAEHCLFLDDAPEVAEKKLRSAVTDTKPTADSRQLEASHMSPGVQTLFTILEAYGDAETVARFRKQHTSGTIKYSELKPAVAEAFIAAHAEFRARKAALMAKPKEIERVLARGAKEAREVAAATLEMARERVGIR